MNTLFELVEKYGTDKTASGYTSTYESIFEPIRNDVKSVLEIGLGTLDPNIPSTFMGNIRLFEHYKQGGSLRVWRDFFPNANVYGIDIAEDCMFEEERIKTFLFDSSDYEKCKIQLDGLKFDIIVDDGNHDPKYQIKTLYNLLPLLNIGGYYIIEDIGGYGGTEDLLVEYLQDFQKLTNKCEVINRGNHIVLKKLEEDTNELKQIFSEVYQNWKFGGWPESKSGPGSTLKETRNLRNKIRDLVEEMEIKSVVDIPCGDFNWMKEIVYGFESYTGCDIVPQLIQDNQKYANEIIKFKEVDITKDEIPSADLIISRDILGHLSLEDGVKAVKNILMSNSKYLLSTTWINIENDEYYTIHKNSDITVNWKNHIEKDGPFFYPVCLGSAPFNFPKPDRYIIEDVQVDGYESGVRKVLGFWEIEKIRKEIKITEIKKLEVTQNLTLVTGLWNLNRPGRDFSHYIENFEKFLEIPCNMFIYIPKEYEHIVWKKRSRENTYVRIFELEDIKNLYSPFWDKTQEIRQDPKWLNITGEGGWLKGSPQAILEWYNPVVMSKMFLLHDAKIMNTFNTDYFLWLDAGITNTVYEKLLTENRALDKILPHLETFLFVSYPYEATSEIHGFDFYAMNRYAKKKVEYVCRGGMFGGHKEYISQANAMYYGLLQETLNAGFMGTEESIFSIMANLQPNIYRRFQIDGNGLIVKYIQSLLDGTAKLEDINHKTSVKLRKEINPDTKKLSIYILTFNFPEQIESTIKTWLKHDKFITKTRNIIIDNSTNEEARIKNKEIADKYGFEHIIMNQNKGICGGRQFVAEHFQNSDSDYYVFIEDDMELHPPDAVTFCRNGFRQGIENLYDKLIRIIGGYDLDFLKFSYTEVFMDNNIQVSWYNVPQHIRTEIWPDYDVLPIGGLDPNAPRTQFKNIEVLDGVSFITGEIYYANWPMIVGKTGNQKMFLDTRWEHPFEQTWMSQMFQETQKGKLNPAVLLASPVNHNRIMHYNQNERREN